MSSLEPNLLPVNLPCLYHTRGALTSKQRAIFLFLTWIFSLLPLTKDWITSPVTLIDSYPPVHSLKILNCHYKKKTTTFSLFPLTGNILKIVRLSYPYCLTHRSSNFHFHFITKGLLSRIPRIHVDTSSEYFPSSDLTSQQYLSQPLLSSLKHLLSWLS